MGSDQPFLEEACTLQLLSAGEFELKRKNVFDNLEGSRLIVSK